MFDIKKVHEYVELREMSYEENHKRVQQEFEQRLKAETDKSNNINEKYEILDVYMDEISTQFIKMLEGFTEEERKSIFRRGPVV